MMPQSYNLVSKYEVTPLTLARGLEVMILKFVYTSN